MEQSARAKATKYNDAILSKDWTPTDTNEQAFIDAFKRLEKDGGHRIDTNYNRRQSPGKKYLEKRSKDKKD